MYSQEDVVLTVKVSALLGSVSDILTSAEPDIIRALEVIEIQEAENPDKESIPIMKRLLKAALEMVEAHKVVSQWVQIHSKGNMKHEGSETIQ